MAGKTMAGSEDAGFLLAPDGPLYCFRHLPEGEMPSGAPVVVFAPSLMEERKCAYGAMTLMARELARRGAAAIRFDYRRTGESPCADMRPSAGCAAFRRLSDMEEDLAAVCVAAREWLPGHPLAVVGLRMGAAVALRASAKISGLAAIAAVAPVVSGAVQARQWRQRSRIRAALTSGSTRAPGTAPCVSGAVGGAAPQDRRAQESVAPQTREDDSGSATTPTGRAHASEAPRPPAAPDPAAAAALEAGAEEIVDLDGYQVSREFLADVESVDLMKCDVPADIRTLLLQVSHRTTPAPELEALSARLGPRCRIVCRRIEPFWDRIDDVDVFPLAGDLAEFLLPQK